MHSHTLYLPIGGGSTPLNRKETAQERPLELGEYSPFVAYLALVLCSCDHVCGCVDLVAAILIPGCVPGGFGGRDLAMCASIGGRECVVARMAKNWPLMCNDLTRLQQRRICAWVMPQRNIALQR